MLDEYTRAERHRYIGSSDAAALAGIDPWGRNAADVFCEKTGRVVADRTSMAMTVGTYLEAGILAWTEAELATPITRDLFVVHRGGILCANLDGAALVAQPAAIIEAKSVGLLGRPHYLEEFGEPGTDEIPSHILLQVHHQLAVTEGHAEFPPLELAYVPALVIGRGFVLYRIEKNQDLCDALVDEAERFWTDHVAKDVPPPEAPSMRTLRRLRRTPEAGVPIDPFLVAAWLHAKETAKATRESEDSRLAQLLAALGDAEVGTCDTGTFSYRAQSRKAYQVHAATFRVPRWKPKEDR